MKDLFYFLLSAIIILSFVSLAEIDHISTMEELSEYNGSIVVNMEDDIFGESITLYSLDSQEEIVYFTNKHIQQLVEIGDTLNIEK